MTLQQLKYVITVAECSSMNEAAKQLFISQPSLSANIHELENELGTDIFLRSNRGIVLTPAGEEFLGYARRVYDQYRLLEDHYTGRESKKHFSVSMQHYSFAVKAFVETVKQADENDYEFAVHETRTQEIIDNVKDFKSELGVIYLNDFNRQVMLKIINDNRLEFLPLFDCDTYVYLWSGHPLADRDMISLDELHDYPCLAFDQGKSNSFYLAEEVKSAPEYKRLIRANDRATMLNLMIGLNGYTLCSGIICAELNGGDYRAVPLKENEKMTIGCLKRKGSTLSPIACIYLEELKKYGNAN